MPLKYTKTFSHMSMSTVLKPGDIVGWEPIGIDQLRFGEMIVFPRGDWIVMHRYLGRLLSKGDTTIDYDRDDLNKLPFVGRVHAIVRGQTSIPVRLSPIDVLCGIISIGGSWVASRLGRRFYLPFRVLIRILAMFQ